MNFLKDFNEMEPLTKILMVYTILSIVAIVLFG